MDTINNALAWFVENGFTIVEAMMRTITWESVITIVVIMASYYHIKNQEKQQKAILALDHKKRFQEIHINLPSNIYESSFDLEALSIEEKEKTLRYMRTYFDLSYESYSAYKRKKMEKKDWVEIKQNINNAMAKPAFQDAWLKLNQTRGYQTKFATFIRKFIDKNNKSIKLEPLQSPPPLNIEHDSV